MARTPYVMTPARAAALRKAQLASAVARKGRKVARVSGFVPRKPRGPSVVPYARVNKRSQTIGVNAGTPIPRTHRRLSVGAYARLEGTRRTTVVDRFVDKKTKQIFPGGTKRGKIANAVKTNVVVHGPSVRASAYGHQVRLGTSRGAGPTIIVRRGKHKTPRAKSKAGVNSYNNHVRKQSALKATAKANATRSKPQRRKAAKKKAS